jgi:hypothetical protein
MHTLIKLTILKRESKKDSIESILKKRVNLMKKILLKQLKN